ncbi:MAG: hypothetical protein DRR06_18640 [Gammaproteobacteria bacterium]|nr:MAG: hypothetical protein DRR06_18640 [Gammaproteobacteria bacterium]
MQQQDYRGPSGMLKADSEWLGVEDLPLERNVKVTILKVVLFKGATFAGGRKKDGGALVFDGKDKMLIINGNRRKTMIRLFGADVSAWWGKTIVLYIDPTVTFGGVQTGGIKIRDKVAEQSQTDAEQMIHSDEPPKADDYEIDLSKGEDPRT